MGKQDFLAGGFYGKVGVLVGQRWKNKRVVRSWVKPHNPRTEKQQANRGRFGGLTAISQLALQMNYHCTAFQSDNMLSWNVRMRTAAKLEQMGLSDLDLIPLAPIGFVTPYIINQCTLQGTTPQGSTLFKISGTLPNDGRKYSFIADIYDTDNEFVERDLFAAKTTDSEPDVLEVLNSRDVSFNENCVCRIVSADDTSSALDMVLSPQISITRGGINWQAWDFAIEDFYQDGNTLHFKTACDFDYTQSDIGAVTVSLEKNGLADSAVLAAPTVYRDGGKVCFSGVVSGFASGDLYTCVNGATVSISQISVDDGADGYKGENVEKTYTQSPAVFTATSADDTAYGTVKISGSLSDGNAAIFKDVQLYCVVLAEWKYEEVDGLTTDSSHSGSFDFTYSGVSESNGGIATPTGSKIKVGILVNGDAWGQKASLEYETDIQQSAYVSEKTLTGLSFKSGSTLGWEIELPLFFSAGAAVTGGVKGKSNDKGVIAAAFTSNPSFVSSSGGLSKLVSASAYPEYCKSGCEIEVDNLVVEITSVKYSIDAPKVDNYTNAVEYGTVAQLFSTANQYDPYEDDGDSYFVYVNVVTSLNLYGMDENSLTAYEMDNGTGRSLGFYQAVEDAHIRMKGGNGYATWEYYGDSPADFAEVGMSCSYPMSRGKPSFPMDVTIGWSDNYYMDIGCTKDSVTFKWRCLRSTFRILS